MEKQFIINHGLILTLLLGSTACTSQGQQADRSSIMDRTAMEEATTIVANQFVKWKNNEGSFFRHTGGRCGLDREWAIAGFRYLQRKSGVY